MLTNILSSSVVFLLLLTICLIYCLKVIPERANIMYLNEKYIEWGKINVKRYGRKSSYYMNVEGANKHTWDNNVTFSIICYEYLHNEYRRSFVEMHFKFCDLIGKEAYVGAMLKNKGLECPIAKGEHHLMNLTVPSEEFPSVFPFEKARAEIIFTQTETKELMMKAQVFVNFKQ